MLSNSSKYVYPNMQALYAKIDLLSGKYAKKAEQDFLDAIWDFSVYDTLERGVPYNIISILSQSQIMRILQEVDLEVEKISSKRINMFYKQYTLIF